MAAFALDRSIDFDQATKEFAAVTRDLFRASVAHVAEGGSPPAQSSAPLDPRAGGAAAPPHDGEAS